jgi:DNA-binding response OmpR family regulator
MKPIRILVAEDDSNILTGLVDTLESEGYRVTGVEDGEQVLELFQQSNYDLVILDIMMPGKSGYDICRSIRLKDATVPIMMLTAKSEEIDKVVGFQLGADDYMTKPFGVHELLARIMAMLRRSEVNKSSRASRAEIPATFALGDIVVDSSRYRIVKGKRERDISSRELKLLHFFFRHPDEVLDRDRILNAVWGTGYFGTTRTLDQHIAQLRKKIEKDPAHPRVIKTVHGVGYRYVRHP